MGGCDCKKNQNKIQQRKGDYRREGKERRNCRRGGKSRREKGGETERERKEGLKGQRKD